MSAELLERHVSVNGRSCRVWEKGRGEPFVWFAGPVGQPTWSPFLEALSRNRRVIVPSIPGFPGGEGHDLLDDAHDWVIAALDLIDGAAGYGADIGGASVGAALAAEVAAVSTAHVNRLMLVAPFGLHDWDAPVENLWAKRHTDLLRSLALDASSVTQSLARPDTCDEIDWEIDSSRAITAGARLMWPLCDIGFSKRAHRVTAPTLVVWGNQDTVVPPVYAARWSERLTSADVTVSMVEGAGHLVDVDQPEVLAELIEQHLSAVKEPLAQLGVGP